MQRCGDKTMKCPRLDHPGQNREERRKRYDGKRRRKQSGRPGLEHPGAEQATGVAAPRTGTSGAEQAAGAAAPSTGSTGDKWRQVAPDWIVRHGTSRRSRRPPDRIIRGQAAAKRPGLDHAPLLPPPRVPAQPRGGDRARTPAGPHPRAPPLPAHPHGTGLRGIPQARHRRWSPRSRHTHPHPHLRPEPAAPPRDSGGSAGPTRSSGSCESGPGESPPSRAWSTGPARGRWRTAASGRRRGGCRRPHEKPCWPMRSTPWESNPATSPRPRTTRMSSGACRRPSRRHSETASACGTSPKAQPRTHTHPHHPTSVGAPTPAAPTAPEEPCAPHNTTRLTPRPAAPPPNPVTQQTTTTGGHARPCQEVTEQTKRRRTPTHTTTGTTTPKGTEPRPATVATA